MVARSLTPVIAVVAAAGLLLVASASMHQVRAGGTHAVEIADFAFSPPILTITAGETVTWTNADPVVHTATSTSGAFDSGDLDQGESYSVTFTTPGTYDYLCTPHPTMTGSIVVQAASASTPAPTIAPPASGGSIPNVAMPAPSASIPLFAGIGLMILCALAIGLERRRRRSGSER